MADSFGLDVAKLVVEVVKVVFVVAGAAWVYWRFFKERTHAPHIEFDLSARFLGPQNGSYVAEYTLTFQNKGLVRQEITTLKLGVRGILGNESLQYRTDRQMSLSFPYVIDDIKNIITENFKYMFIEPNIVQQIRHVSKVDSSFAFVLVRAKFLYRSNVEHTAAKVFEVKAVSVTEKL